MVKVFEVVKYNRQWHIYTIVFRCLDERKAMKYAAAHYKLYKPEADMRYIVQARWIMLDGESAPEVLWEFKHNKQTKVVEESIAIPDAELW